MGSLVRRSKEATAVKGLQLRATWIMVAAEAEERNRLL